MLTCKPQDEPGDCVHLGAHLPATACACGEQEARGGTVSYGVRLQRTSAGSRGEAKGEINEDTEQQTKKGKNRGATTGLGGGIKERKGKRGGKREIKGQRGVGKEGEEDKAREKDEEDKAREGGEPCRGKGKSSRAT